MTPRRSPIQFGLGSMLLLVLLIATLTGWWADRRAQRLWIDDQLRRAQLKYDVQRMSDQEIEELYRMLMERREASNPALR